MFVETLAIFLWKHWRNMRSRWFSFLCNFVVPIAFAIFMIYISDNIKRYQYDGPDDGPKVYNEHSLTNPARLVYYAPENSLNSRIMEKVQHNMAKEKIDLDMVSFYGKSQMNDFIRDNLTIYDKTLCVLFAEKYSANQPIRYTILPINYVYNTDEVLVNDYLNQELRFRNEYDQSGFLALQRAIDTALIQHWENDDRLAPKIKIEFQEMPTNANNMFDYDPMLYPIEFFWFLYTFTLINMVLVPTVEEKESGIKEFLRIATSYSALNMVTYYVLNVLIGIVMFGTVMVAATIFELTKHFVMVYMMVLILLYVMSSVAFSFMLSVMFKTVFFAKNAGFLFYIGQMIILIIPEVSFMKPIFNNVLFLDGLEAFDRNGLRCQIFDWNDLFYSTPKHYSMFSIYMLLLMDTCIYLTLYIYLIQVFPGTFGTPKPFWFPFLPSTYVHITNLLTAKSERLTTTADGKEVVVRVRGLCKEFKAICEKPKLAVNGLNLDICKNQITVLLGHNGAGKTTTMSIISGIIPKTSGTIVVDGKANVDAYRNKVGYCPQHNVFLPYFTCIQHLQFFGCLRGLPSRDAQKESMKLLDKLHMKHKAHEYGTNLSGGMKRRLCLGNAIIGNTQIAILDEPSSGLDPESRRELWDVLLELRKNHTILITTHYMEEAEMLADYISIMSRGEIICDGTAISLKRQYAHGYLMKLLTTDAFNVDQLMPMVQRHIPSAVIHSFIKPTINITLPYKYLDSFPAMLKEVEDQMQDIGIATISLTDASLEDVFLNCDPHKHQPDQTVQEVSEDTVVPGTDTNIPQTNINLIWHQILGITYKKCIFVRRHIIYFLLSIAMLFLATTLSYIPINGSSMSNNSQETNRAPALTISPQSIRNTDIFLNVQSRGRKDVTAFENTLRSILYEHNVRVRDWTIGQNVSELLEFEREDIRYYHEQILCAIRVKPTSERRLVVRILYSKNWWHSSAIALNLVDNVIARLNNKSGNARTIVTVNEPLSKQYPHTSSPGHFEVYLLLMPLALFSYMLFYVYLPYSDEISEFKKLLPVSPVLYWMTTFVFDVLLHCIVCTILILFHIPLDTHRYFGVKEFGSLFSIYFVYGLATLPFLYISAQIFSSISSLYSYLTYTFLVPFLLATVLSQGPFMQMFSHWISVLLFIPNYALEHGLNRFMVGFEMAHGVHITKGLHRYFFNMIFVTVVLMLFLIYFMESPYRRDALHRWYLCCKRKLLCRKPPIQKKLISETADVIREKEHTESVVHSNMIQNYAICVRQLSKKFDLFEAVRNVSFTVGKGECFGLLGMNGAGKTTTFKMMTRDLPITTGKIYFNGLDSTANTGAVDALNTFMTAYETLKFMAIIRGTPLNEIDRNVCQLLRNTDLESYKDVLVKNYSGGTKRKLNTALAMHSDPPLVFLDEPTTGVDPSSRRFIWSCIQNCQKQNKNIVLTSHSMDECEFLCNRLAIMNNGQLNCIGPVLELKKRFDLGFLITVVLKPVLHQTIESIDDVRSAIRTHFDCVLREEYGNQLCYLVSDKDLRWSDVFKKLQSVKQQFEMVVSDFSITESSLEDIFLKIARESNVETQQSV